MTNHYRTLGVDPQADTVVIRSAYLALIRRYHPDKGGDEADPARAQAVTAAWDVLRDPDRRAAYDESRRARFQPDAPAAPGAAVRRGPTVRGGAAGRNLFLLLAAGTVALGWWALGQPQFSQPPARIAANSGEPVARTPVELAILPSREEPDQSNQETLADQPPLPDVRREPVEAPVVSPPLPVSDPVRMPVRTAEDRQVRPRTEPASSARAETRPAGAAPPSSPTATPRIDLVALERHLQLLTDQSFRFGTEAKKARLMETREAFLTRLSGCTTDSCRRDAYLRRNAEIGEIMRN